jgi:hypothetical protein
MLRMSVALVGTIGVSLLLTGSPAMAQTPDPVMAAQMTVGTGTYPYRYSAATYSVYTGMTRPITASAGTQASQYLSLRLVP